MFNAIIVDDDRITREAIAIVLKNNCPEIEVLASDDTIKAANS